MSAVVWCLNVVCHCLSFGLEWKLPWFSYSMTCLQGDQKSSPSLSLLSHSSLTVGARGRVYKHETTSLALECSSWLTRTGRTLHCPQPTFDLILQISHMNEFMPLQWFNSMWTENFQMDNLHLEKTEEPEIKLSTSTGSSKKQESSRKKIYFHSLLWST